jgi:glycosyltransferase involved in cell wall biosynthesis
VRITVYPADSTGCGHFRLIWAAQELARQGHDVDLRPPDRRDLKIKVAGGETDRDAYVEDVLDFASDVVIFQRVTHRFVSQVIPILRAKGIAVVVDIDDDLTAIHPRNPAYAGYHPQNEWRRDRAGKLNRHSWRNLTDACQAATLVTVSSPGLLNVYARHGRGRVIYNHLPEHYYGVPHRDSDLVGWPAYLQTHPDDPSCLGGAVARLYDDGGAFQVIADPTGCGAAFGLPQDPPGHSPVGLEGWPAAVSELGIGLCPLAETKFNRSKSWLKPLELSAVGVPWIGSPRPEYVRLNGMGCGLLADTPRRWYQAINRLRNNPGLRQELAEGGRAVADTLRLEPAAWKWMEAWSDAYRLQHAPDPARTTV